MTWKCNLVRITGTKTVKYDVPAGGGISGKTFLVDEAGNLLDFRDLPIGTMFELPVDADKLEWPWYTAGEHRLSDYYFANNKDRNPLFVVLPGPYLFLIDGKCWNSQGSYGGWTVTGEAPNITVSPSINIGGTYHGWLQSGEISPDCEGRQFNERGNQVETNLS